MPGKGGGNGTPAPGIPGMGGGLGTPAPGIPGRGGARGTPAPDMPSKKKGTEREMVTGVGRGTARGGEGGAGMGGGEGKGEGKIVFARRKYGVRHKVADLHRSICRVYFGHVEGLPLGPAILLCVVLSISRLVVLPSSFSLPIFLSFLFVILFSLSLILSFPPSPSLFLCMI